MKAKIFCRYNIQRISLQRCELWTLRSTRDKKVLTSRRCKIAVPSCVLSFGWIYGSPSNGYEVFLEESFVYSTGSSEILKCARNSFASSTHACKLAYLHSLFVCSGHECPAVTLSILYPFQGRGSGTVNVSTY